MSYVRKPLGAAETSVPAVNVPKVAGAALVYHGYRRTGSLIWAAIYGLAGYKLPIVAVPVAVAQGFGKRRICTTEE